MMLLYKLSPQADAQARVMDAWDALQKPVAADKLQKAREWLAQRVQERGPHRYVPGAPSVLLPVQQRYVERVQKQRVS